MNEDILVNGNENIYLFVYTFLLVGGDNLLGEYYVVRHTYIENINANGVSLNQPKSGDNMKKNNSLVTFHFKVSHPLMLDPIMFSKE